MGNLVVGNGGVNRGVVEMTVGNGFVERVEASLELLDKVEVLLEPVFMVVS